MEPILQGSALIFVVGLMVTINSRTRKEIEYEVDSKIKTMHKRIDDLQGHIDKRFDDIKDLIKRNGK